MNSIPFLIFLLLLCTVEEQASKRRTGACHSLNKQTATTRNFFARNANHLEEIC